MPLSDVEVRVLGALVEKERTTPDAYPLSSQALVTACNQRTNRDPVTDYHLQEVQEATFHLRERGFVRTLQEAGDRVPKHQHQLARVWDVEPLSLSLMAVLMLRGPQTPGELRARIERYGVPNDPARIEAALRSLADRASPLVHNLGRRPGQSQDRWRHALGNDESRLRPRVRAPGAASERASERSSERSSDALPGAAAARGAGAANDAPPGGATVTATPGAEAVGARAGHAGAAEPADVGHSNARLERRLAELERRVAVLEAALANEAARADEA